MMNSQELYDDRKEAAQNYYNDQRALNNPAFTNRTFDQYLQATIPSSVLNTNSEWQSLLTRVGYVNKQSLSVSGGDKKTSFYIGGNYYHELGTLLGEKYDRYNLRANLRHQISDRFTIVLKPADICSALPKLPQVEKIPEEVVSLV